MPAGTVLFSSRAPIGYVALAANPLCTNQGFKSFVLSGALSSDYVYHFLVGNTPLATALASGTTFLELSAANAARIPIALPPREEQDRIVTAIEEQLTRLDAAVATLTHVQASLKYYRDLILRAACAGHLLPTEAELARERKRSYEPASEMLSRFCLEHGKRTTGARSPAFGASRGGLRHTEKVDTSVPPSSSEITRIGLLPEGWTWTTWNDAAARVTVGHVGRMKHEYVDHGVPFLRSQNVRENRFNPVGLLYISSEFHRRLAKSSLHPGDLVVVRSGSVGTTCVIPESLGESNCSDLVIIKGPMAVDPRFGCYYMNSLARRHIRAGQVGIALTHFNTKSVAALPIPVPPKNEQYRIVEEVERRLSVVDELDVVVGVNLERAERLRQSVLKRAFEGKLAPQVPNDEPARTLLERIRAERVAQIQAVARRTPARRGLILDKGGPHEH